MCAAFLVRPNWPIRTGGDSNDGPIRAVQEAVQCTHTLYYKRRYQSRRCGDDSHPGEEIYTPSGNEARLLKSSQAKGADRHLIELGYYTF